MDGKGGSLSLFWRIFLLNAALVTAATLLLLGPITVSTPVLLTEAAILAAGLVAMLIANAALLRVGLAPLRRLTRTMTTIDLLQPEPRQVATGSHTSIADLIRAFNAMIDRLEAERATSTARALSAQEGERRRIAQELHDEVGQTLTAVLLELKQVARSAPEPVRTRLHEVQETTRQSLDEIRRIARRLRPGVLEELGLLSALKSLTTEITGRTNLAVTHHLSHDLPPLDRETELVIYRVAQESLTNIVRHARATTVDLSLRPKAGGVELRIRDNGCGIGNAAEGAGIRGMRERALLIGAHLTLTSIPSGGTEVQLSARLRGERSNRD